MRPKRRCSVARIPVTRSPAEANAAAASATGSRSSSRAICQAYARHVSEVSAKTLHARELFAPLGPSYDRYARLLSFGQDPRWRRFLVSRVHAGVRDVVLDLAAGTGAVALELVRQKGCSVVGVDQSPEMLAEADRRIKTDRVRLVQ